MTRMFACSAALAASVLFGLPGCGGGGQEKAPPGAAVPTTAAPAGGATTTTTCSSGSCTAPARSRSACWASSFARASCSSISEIRWLWRAANASSTAVRALIIANVALFLPSFFAPLFMQQWFGLVPELVLTKGYVWQLATYAFVHAAPPHWEHILLNMFGPEKIAMGSDYPFPLGEDVPGSLIERMNLTPLTKERLLSGTALEWLGMTKEKFLT